MDHASSSSGLPQSDKLLGLSAQLLGLRDFSSCRELALKARKYDPYNSRSDQILAIANTLVATEHRDPTDWYSILQIARPDSGNSLLIRNQFEKLAALLNPNENRFAFAPEAFGLVQRAWAVLSDPEKKTHFGNEFKNGQELPEQREQGKETVGNEKNGNGGETFWTVCPYCYCMYEYKKVYEDCCLKCQNCRKAFHGVAIKVPSPDIIVPGKEQYYVSFGYFSMEYMDPEKKDRGANDKKDKVVVEISDGTHDDDDDDGFNAKSGTGSLEGIYEGVVKSGDEGDVGVSGRAGLTSEGKTARKRWKAPARRKRSTKLKSPATDTKKIMGNGISRRVELVDDGKVEEKDMSVEDGNGIVEGGCGSGSGMGGGLQFFEGEDDIFVCIGDSPC